MGKFVAVNKQTVKRGREGLEKLLNNEPQVKKQEEKERKEFEQFIAIEKKRRDDEHRAGTSSRTNG